MKTHDEPRIRTLLMEDVRKSDYTKTLRTDFRKLTEFMLSDEKKTRLEKMHGPARWIHQAYWLLRALIINLTPTRRLILVLALVLYCVHFDSDNGSGNLYFFSFLCMLFILMLELKDKLLALRELEAGHGVQLSLMPEQNPSIEGWDMWLYSKSANEVGGDLVDFMEFKPGTYYAAIGDVSGKGLSAALLAVKLQATLRALISFEEPLEILGTRLNQTFCRDCMPQMFASLIYVQLDGNSNNLTIMNAGHFPPVIITKDGTTRFAKGGAALGLHNSMKFMTQELTVQDDEMIFFYTDGLIEAQNENGEFFGEDRLSAFLPKLHQFTPADAGIRLVEAVDYFCGDEDRKDDLSLIILRKKKQNNS
ncbi:MAG: serine/threonine-protein phosphatase [Ignavibacteria bacterium]|nr:serine/threonine-protein phosphatase [Ignavibacteria bacterium]